jgi:hypothetical protein
MYKTHHWMVALTLEKAEELDAHNKPVYIEACAKWREAEKLIKNAFGEKSKEYRYVSNIRIPPPPNYVTNLKRAEEAAANKLKKAEEEKAQAAKEQEQREAHTKRIVEATKYLLSNGVEPDIDPIGEANELARTKGYEERLGTEMDCGCDDCGNWTVGERRCNCGNRRVYLSSDGPFDNMYFYAECD